MPSETIEVEVACALPERQQLLRLSLPAGATIGDAIARSKILHEFPDVTLSTCKTGIFGKVKSLDTALSSGDRVEIYRPLLADPKEVRRQRAAAGKAMKKGG